MARARARRELEEGLLTLKTLKSMSSNVSCTSRIFEKSAFEPAAKPTRMYPDALGWLVKGLSASRRARRALVGHGC